MQPQTQPRQNAGQQSRQSAGQQSRRTRTYRTAVALPPGNREQVVEMLNRTLADATDLMTQAKVAHWNVKGMNFYQLHLLFDEVAETLNEHVDVVAERTTAIGGEATGTVRDAASNSRIPEMPPDVTTGPEYVEALVERVGIHANNLRRDIEIAVERDDEGTADMYTELSRELDKQLYFLEAHLQSVRPEAIPASPGASSQYGASGGQSQYRMQSQQGQSQSHQPRGQNGSSQYGRSAGQYAGNQMQSQFRQSGPPRGQQSDDRRTGY